MSYFRGTFQRSGSHGAVWSWLLGIVLSVLAQGPAGADDTTDNSLTLRGFGTLGLARSTTDNAEFVRDLSQPGGISKEWSSKIDSLLGVQANFQFAAPVEAVAQIVSRYHYDDSHQPELMWGFLKFDPNASLDLRLGRLGTEFYMLSDSRLVGYSYVTVRPSNDYFGGLPFSYFDGADALLTLPMGDGLVRGKIMAGWAREKVPSGDLQFDLDHSLMLGGYLDYQMDSWQWRLGYSQLHFHNEMPIAPLLQALRSYGFFSVAEGISTADKLMKYYSVGAVYDKGPLEVQLMLNQVRYESVFLENYHAGYLLGTYRIGQFSPFAGISWVKSSPKSSGTGLTPTNPLEEALLTRMRDSHSDQHTFTLGTRWDFHKNLACKAQWDAIRGKPDSIFPYRWETANWSGHMNVFSLTLDFVF
ncbi:conserved hypothetical protein [Gammaproteobacteria bacterium]